MRCIYKYDLCSNFQLGRLNQNRILKEKTKPPPAPYPCPVPCRMLCKACGMQYDVYLQTRVCCHYDVGVPRGPQLWAGFAVGPFFGPIPPPPAVYVFCLRLKGSPAVEVVKSIEKTTNAPNKMLIRETLIWTGYRPLEPISQKNPRSMLNPAVDRSFS